MSYVGYDDQVVDLVASKTVYDITLRETSTAMDEVASWVMSP